MDHKQSNFHPKLTVVAFHFLGTLLLMVSIAGCNLPAEPNSQDIDRVVGATLTEVARQAKPTQTERPPLPTQAPATLPPPSQTPLEPTIAPATSTPTLDQSEAEQDGVPGVISGSLSYPSEQIPRLAVVFFNLNDGSWWWVGTAVNQASYQMTVPVGRYHVVAYAEGGIAGGYTAAVPCGLTVACTDHSLLTVNVGSNERVTGINVTDWYAPPGAFPSKPAGVSYP